MDDNSSPTNISSTNTVDDNYDDDGWTAEEEAHLTEAWLLLLLRGPDSIKVQDIMYRLLRDMELTNEDFEIASVDLQMLGTNRDAEELKELFAQWMTECENRINEGLSAVDEEASEGEDSEEEIEDEDNKIMSKL